MSRQLRTWNISECRQEGAVCPTRRTWCSPRRWPAWGVTLHTRKVAGPIPAGTTENRRMTFQAPTGRNVVQRIQGRRDVIELVVVEVGIDVRGHRDRCTARPSRRTGYRFPGPGPPQIQVMASTALPKNDFHASGTGMYPLSAKPFCPAPMVLCRNAFTAAPTCGSRYFEQTIS
jgi:hypothetical protein